ncbi:hypothetical protein FACS1894186_3870 [Alphaproteobacteria bacterium]|nr:hypothetical protein FACS1894186_3870 [Alphaproteobacteria bacterium]
MAGLTQIEITLAARGADIGAILSRHVAGPLVFRRAAEGKPYLEGLPVHYSVSHSRELLAVAVAPCPVGVDIEFVRPRDFAGLARNRLAGADLEAVLSAPAAAVADEFYRGWTRFEASVKLIGTGIFAPPTDPPEFADSRRIGGYWLSVAAGKPLGVIINMPDPSLCLE